MREWIRRFILILCCGLGFVLPARSQQPLTLENSELKVTLSPQNATLMSVVKKQSNTSYLGSSKQAGWFRIQIPLANWEGHASASNDLKVVSVQRRGPDAIEIRAQQIVAKENKYPVSFKLSLRLERDNLVGKLTLQNQSTRTIDRI